MRTFLKVFLQVFIRVFPALVFLIGFGIVLPMHLVEWYGTSILGISLILLSLSVAITAGVAAIVADRL